MRAFRAGHRATPQLEEAAERHGVITVRASHDGYERLPGRPRHRRTWHAGPDHLHIDDEVTGAQPHPAVSRVHLAPGIAAEFHADGTVAAGGCVLAFDVPSPQIHPPDPAAAAAGSGAWSATAFGQRRAVTVIAQAATVPARLSLTIRWPAAPDQTADGDAP